jgi:hypothetical protein
MENIREKAKEVLESNYTYWQGSYYQNCIIDAMLIFARKQCELQKQECAENAELLVCANTNENNYFTTKRIEYKIDDDYNDGISHNESIKIDKDSILNCKNVCDE